MNFTIGGKQHEVAREDVIIATRNSSPAITDRRHKYFVKLHNRKYPIKQVVRLVTGLSSAEFTAHDAHRILTKLGFDITDTSSPGSETVKVSDPSGEVLYLVVVFETDEDGWEVVSCPTLPGCHSQGRTRGEALANIAEAISGYLASLREHGAPTPASTEFDVVEVPA